MRVTVRLFAQLREIAGATELVRAVPEGSTVASVWDGLVGEWPALARHGGSISSAVNAEYAGRGTRVADGDEIAFLPPVSGG